MAEPVTTVAEHDVLPAPVGPAWARGLTLVERTLLAMPVARADPGDDRARRRLSRWRRAHDLEETSGLAAFLETLPGGEDELLALLAEAPPALARRVGGPPEWWTTVRDLPFTATSASSPTADHHDDSIDWPHEFALITGAFRRRAVAELIRRLRDQPGREAVAAKPVLLEFASALNGSLVSLATRTLVLELNVLRMQGRLSGGTPGERFLSFVGYVGSPAGQEALFDEYPVLARLLLQRTDMAVEAAWELLRRWIEDREAIVAQLFRGADPGRLTSVGFVKGDVHQGGRSVAIVGFESGARLVYKPRPLGVHTCFNALLRWLDARSGGLGLRALAVLDRGRYGWLEYAEHHGCASAEEVGRYYHRLGALMALLYAMNGADFHYENLIACGEQPVLVDLETMFHQPAPSPPGTVQADDPALAVQASSVLRLGLLPMPVSNADGAIDLGGLGGEPTDRTPHPSAIADNGGTDAMRMVRRHLEFVGAQNRPSVDGMPADLTRFIEPLIGGFRAAYQVILDHRDELTGLVERFADVELRTVLRATQIYATLLGEGTHPDLLRDALDRDRHFGFLWAASADHPALSTVVIHELAELWEGDVPMFTSRPASRDLWTSAGVRLPDFFPRSGVDRVRDKLAGLGDDDMRRQEWVIRAALQTRPGITTAARSTRAEARSAAAADDSAAAERCVAAARTVADRLIHLSIQDDDGRVGWLGLHLADESAWRVGAVRWDLYSGSVGIALFLSRFAEIVGDERYRDVATRALWALPRMLKRLDELSTKQLTELDRLGERGGGLTGLPGLAYALTHIGGSDPVLLGLSEQAIRLVSRLVDADEQHDILGGSAGTIAALLAVHAQTGMTEALAVARRCGEHLLDRAMSIGDGLAWSTLAGARRPLTGFSHGASGIGWALLRLGAAVDDRRFIDAALAAFAYERGEYQPEAGNWPDYRTWPGGPDPDGGPTSFMHAWCHGATGIGLARADALNLGALADADEIRADLAAAVSTTLDNGFGYSHSLCHGDLGNAELLLLADEVGALERTTYQILDSLAASGPRCGTPSEVETPGLMTGLAGIGYGLLRLATPDRVPSVLLAQPALLPR